MKLTAQLLKNIMNFFVVYLTCCELAVNIYITWEGINRTTQDICELFAIVHAVREKV